MTDRPRTAAGLGPSLQAAWLDHANDPDWHVPRWDDVNFRKGIVFDGCDIVCMLDIAARPMLPAAPALDVARLTRALGVWLTLDRRMVDLHDDAAAIAAAYDADKGAGA